VIFRAGEVCATAALASAEYQEPIGANRRVARRGFFERERFCGFE